MNVWVLAVWAACGVVVATGETAPFEVLHSVADVTVILAFMWGAFRGAVALSEVYKQVTNNGGTSMKDKVEAAETAIATLNTQMDTLQKEMGRQSKMLENLSGHAGLPAPPAVPASPQKE